MNAETIRMEGVEIVVCLDMVAAMVVDTETATSTVDTDSITTGVVAATMGATTTNVTSIMQGSTMESRVAMAQMGIETIGR